MSLLCIFYLFSHFEDFFFQDFFFFLKKERKREEGENRNPFSPVIFFSTKINWRTSLVTQWLRIRLPMQGTRVPALIREDPT